MKVQFHYVYQTTNLLDNKIYIGVHSTYKINDGYLGSGKRLLNAIKKYGKENFSKEILSFYDTKEEAYEEETYIVTKEWVSRLDTYNILVGGIGRNKEFKKGSNNSKFIVDAYRYPSGRIKPKSSIRGKSKKENVRYYIYDSLTNITYSNLIELSNFLNLTRVTVSKKINNNTLDKRFIINKIIIPIKQQSIF